MTFSEFKKAYITAFQRMMSYPPGQAGSKIYAEKMADLYDAHPEWADKVENEIE